MGSAQHLKARYGAGFDVEVKLGPTPLGGGAAVAAAIASCGAPGCTAQHLAAADLPAIASALGDPAALAEVTATGSGWPIYTALLAPGARVAASEFSAWWAAEACARTVVRHFVGGAGGAGAAFEGAALCERQGSLLRFKVPNRGKALWEMFAVIEEAKAGLGVAFDAALGQTSLEAIFNGFAAQQEEERTPVRGWR